MDGHLGWRQSNICSTVYHHLLLSSCTHERKHGMGRILQAQIPAYYPSYDCFHGDIQPLSGHYRHTVLGASSRHPISHSPQLPRKRLPVVVYVSPHRTLPPHTYPLPMASHCHCASRAVLHSPVAHHHLPAFCQPVLWRCAGSMLVESILYAI